MDFLKWTFSNGSPETIGLIVFFVFAAVAVAYAITSDSFRRRQYKEHVKALKAEIFKLQSSLDASRKIIEERGAEAAELRTKNIDLLTQNAALLQQIEDIRQNTHSTAESLAKLQISIQQFEEKRPRRGPDGKFTSK